MSSFILHVIFLQLPWLLDYDSNVDACLKTLKELGDRLAVCAVKAERYRSHQRTFKVSMFIYLEYIIRHNIYNRKMSYTLLDRKR